MLCIHRTQALAWLAQALMLLAQLSVLPWWAKE
jgi:hypothetical protein